MTPGHLLTLMLWSGQVEGPPPPASAPAPAPAPATRIMAVPVATVVPAAPQLDPRVAREWSLLRDRQRLGRRLAAGGFAGLGAAFAANVVGGVASGELGEDPTGIVGLLPVVGPFVFAGWQSPNTPGWRAFFVVDGLAQAGMLSLGIVGAVIAKRSRRALAGPRFHGLDARLTGHLDNDPDLVRRGRRGLGMSIGGFAGFGAAYVGTMAAFISSDSEALLTGKDDVQRAWAVLPLAGPFVVAGQADLAGTRALAAVLGVVQVGSLATGIAGAVIRGRRVRDAESRVLSKINEHRVSFAPWAGGHITGLMIRGQF